jgi:hypothetical protein
MNEDIPFSTVLLLQKEDSSMIKGTISTEAGTYLFEDIATGNYFLQSSFVGFEKTFSPSFLLTKNTIAPLMTLREGSELSEVVVRENKPLYVNEIDRTVINVASSLVSAGGTALEILERSPGVIVNRQSNSIALVGKSGVVLMINGKISYMPAAAVVQMLQGMSADNIESIELITTPPAQFDAEGNAGYINIILKKRLDEGFNGTYSLSAGYGKGLKTNDNLTLNYRKGKANLFGTYSYVQQNGFQPFEFERDYLRNGQDISIFTMASRDTKQENHNLRMGMDFDVSKKTVLGFLFTGYQNAWAMNSLNQGATKVNNVKDSSVEVKNSETNTWSHLGANFNLTHKFSDKNYVSYDIDYLNYDNSNPNNYTNSFFNNNDNLASTSMTRSTKRTPLYTWVSRLDFHNVLGTKGSIDYGVKGSYNNFENRVEVQNQKENSWVTDKTLSSSSFLNETILAAYSSMDYQFNNKTSLKAGLRYEHTDSELETETGEKLVDRNYGLFFPTFYISHKVNKNLSMNWAYNKRITRPTFNDLAPFVILLDPNTFISGNAAIQPAISNSVKYALSYKSLFVSLDYSHQKYSIANFQQFYDDVNDRFVFSAANLDYTNTFSATIAAPLKVNKWWNMNNNLILLHQKVKSSIYVNPLEFSVLTYQFNTTQSFRISDKLMAEGTTFFSGPSFFGTYKVKPFYGINLGMQYKLKSDKGSLRLALTDLAESIKYRTEISVPSENFSSRNVWDFSNRTLMLTYTSSFGRKEIKSSRGRQGGATEERARVN